jgi:hypothetical protein
MCIFMHTLFNRTYSLVYIYIVNRTYSLFQAVAFAMFAISVCMAAPAPQQVVTRVHAVPNGGGDLQFRTLPANFQDFGGQSFLQEVTSHPQTVLRAQPLVQQSVRTGSAVSHSHSSITHENPSHTLIRAQPLIQTVGRSQQVLQTVAHAQPLVQSFARAQPLLHTVAHPETSVLRTVAHPQQQTLLRTVAHPQQQTLLRTVAHPQQQTLLRTVAQPQQQTLLRTVVNPQQQTVLRTVAHPQQSVLRTVVNPQQTVLRTVAHPEIHTVAHVGPTQIVRTVPVVDDLVHRHAQYNYGYSVNDAASGDSKARQESRNGDVVTGSYTVADPDGRIRHVEYTADKEHGFNARVTYDGEPGPVSLGLDAPRTHTVAHTVPFSAGVGGVEVIAARDTFQPVQTLQGGSILRNQVIQGGNFEVVAARNTFNPVQTLQGGSILRNQVLQGDGFEVVAARDALNPVQTIQEGSILRNQVIHGAGGNFEVVAARDAFNPVQTIQGGSILRSQVVPASNVFRTNAGTFQSVSQSNPLVRAQLIDSLPAGTQFFQNGQLVRATNSFQPQQVIHVA